MAERPVLFAGSLVRAILGGRKTETRRLIGPGTSAPKVYSKRDLDFSKIEHVDGSMRTGFGGTREPSPHDYVHVPVRQGHEWEGARDRVCPWVIPGDTLYVRESFRYTWIDGHGTACTIRYAADGAERRIVLPRPHVVRESARTAANYDRGRPGMHLPRWASRVELRVTDVAAQRLTDITEADAAAEGIEPDAPGGSARDAFARVWDAIYSDGSAGWSADPWVWVVRFQAEDVRR